MAYADIVSAHGGWIVVEDGTDYFILDNTSYDYNVTAIESDVTTSASAGWKQSITVLKSVDSISVSMPYDSAADLEIVGIALGGIVNLHCKKGANSKYDIFNGTHFQGLSQTINNSDGEPIRRVYTFVKGALTSNASAESGVTTYLATIGR